MQGMRSPSRPFADQGGVVVLAHRGFSSRYPENTLLAFEKAAELPADGLEMDIYATKDGHLVVSHDEAVDRVTNGTGLIQDYTLAALKELDAGYHFSADGGQTYPFRDQGLTIPTMAEVLEAFGDMWINVDIKQHDAETVERFCRLIDECEAHERLCVGSFSSKTVQQFRKACPRVVTLATLTEVAVLFVLDKLHLARLFDGQGRAMQIPPQAAKWGIAVDVVTPGFIGTAHRRNAAVHVWTLNEEPEMRRFVEMGVDGIITDYPERALQVLGRLPADVAPENAPI